MTCNDAERFRRIEATLKVLQTKVKELEEKLQISERALYRSLRNGIKKEEIERKKVIKHVRAWCSD